MYKTMHIMGEPTYQLVQDLFSISSMLVSGTVTACNKSISTSYPPWNAPVNPCSWKMICSFEWGIRLIFRGMKLLLVWGYTKSCFGPPKPNRQLKVPTFTASLKNMGTVSSNLKAKVVGYHGYRSIMTHKIHVYVWYIYIYHEKSTRCR